MATLEEMRTLVDQLNAWSHAYYTLDQPIRSDAEYDATLDRLAAMEEELQTVLPDSPTHRVGDAILPGFLPHTHLAPLFSMDKAQTSEALFAWDTRVRKLREEAIQQSGQSLPPIRYALEYKFDGLTINLTYKDGILIQAATRGNGQVGEAILPQVRTIRSIPSQIPYMNTVEIQGECIMPLSVLEEYNKTSDEPLKNARNAAAGALRNLDPAVTAARKLSAFFYEVGYIEDKSFSDYEDTLQAISLWGMPVGPMTEFYDDIYALYARIQDIGDERDKLDFLIDGAVIKVCDTATRTALGSTAKFPRWELAYKFEPEEMSTYVRNVIWQVGRTGKLTPVAEVDPVDLSGVTVRRATLNNWDDIQRKKVAISARVIIRRSNDVIPEILGAVPSAESTLPIQVPLHCPECGTDVLKDGAHLYCPNYNDCPPQVISRLVHFASREAMDIDTFAGKTAGALLEQLPVQNPADLYTLTREQLLQLPGFKEKKADNLLLALEASKHVPLSRFLYALGIRNVGIKTARDIARRFGTLEAIQHADVQMLSSVDGIGTVVAESIRGWFDNPQHMEMLSELLAVGVTPIPEEAVKISSLNGKIFVLTGTLSDMDRHEATERIEAAGGKVSSSVSKKTSYVVAGDAAGSKLDKALEFGIPVLDQDAFLKLLKESERTY